MFCYKGLEVLHSDLDFFKICVRVFLKNSEIFLKKYNSDKTFVQIKKETHNKLKEFCVKNNLKIKDFLEKIIINSI